MIYTTERLLRRARRLISRSEWAVRLLRLPKSETTATEPGLVIIQVDGLSHSQLCAAMESGKMPFLQRLLAEEHYRLHEHYSGLPSSTPAVQAELFYGVKGAVPAFGYFDRSLRRHVSMLDTDVAAAVERELESRGTPLLEGGSAYADIFTGGAAESHFCPASFGWGSLLRAANPLGLGFLVLTNALAILRTGVLLVVECGLAVVDCIRGLIAGQDLLDELKFVPTRVAICILIREFATLGAEIDVARGLPVVHLNYLGYDEQAHRRGPTSKFATWSLKGIDRSIARVWRAAKRSARRDYDIWVYSDHGQEKSIPYSARNGRSIEEAVTAAFGDLAREDPQPGGGLPGIQSQRARLLGGKWLQRVLPSHDQAEAAESAGQPVVAAVGPVAFVYSKAELTPVQRPRLAEALVRTAKVPLVLASDGPASVRVWSADGERRLPDDKEAILGGDHPFLEEVSRDLIDLCRHPNAGDFVLCGWSKGGPAYSFPNENGAHAGPGHEETRGFALLPGDTALPRRDRQHLRPLDLRQSALHILGRRPLRDSKVSAFSRAKGRILRVMTYNVHRCTGMDGTHSPERVARVIAQYRPDVIALQELDAHRSRTGGVDQAHIIATYLQMEWQFHPAIRLEEELYGDAVLTHLPMRLVRAGNLPGQKAPRLEPRGALWVAISVAGREIQVINTHLGLTPRERRLQVDTLLGPQWLGHPDCRPPTIFCGDLNAVPSSAACRDLRRRLKDVQADLAGLRPSKTFFGRYPAARIDHIFVDPDIEVTNVEVPRTNLTRVASDHLPLIVDLRIPED